MDGGSTHRPSRSDHATSSTVNQQSQAYQTPINTPSRPVANTKIKRARPHLDPLQHFIHDENDHLTSFLSAEEPLVSNNGEQLVLNQVLDHVTQQFDLEPRIANTDYNVLQGAAILDANYQYQYDEGYSYDSLQLQGDLAGVGSQFDQQS